MRRLSITSLLVTAFGVLVLAGLLLNSGGHSAQGAVGVADSAPGGVALVAIDMDPTLAGGSAAGANPTGCFVPPAGALSSIQNTITIAGFASTTIDIVVDEVDAADAMSGFSFNLLYDDSIVGITGKSFATSCLSTATEIDPDEGPLPQVGGGCGDGDAVAPESDVIIDDGCFGNFRMDAGVIGGMAVGEGVLVSLTLTCKVASGESFLDLTDLVGGDGIPDILDGVNFGAPLTVAAEGDAHIGCGVAPDGAVDVEITTETINGPVSMAVSTPTTYTDNKTIDSDSLTPVAVTLGTGIIPPADCTAYADPGTYLDAIDSTPFATTGVSASTPLLSPATDATVTSVGHSLSTGDTVIISGVSGAVTEAASRDVNHIHTVGATTANTFDLVGVRTLSLGGAGFAARVIGTSVGALNSLGASSGPTFGLECSEPSFHDTAVTNEIFLDDPKTYGTCDAADNCSDPTAMNSVSHSTGAGVAVTVAGPNGTTEAGGTTGEKMRVAVTAAADADFGVPVITNNLTDTDNNVPGAELKKGETKTITFDHHVTLVSSDVLPVTFELDFMPININPSGCTTTPNQTNPEDVIFAALGTAHVALTYDITCTSSGIGFSPNFLRLWDFHDFLSPADPHVVDPDGIAGDNFSENPFSLPVIEPFVATMDIQQSSTDDPSETANLPDAGDECLTVAGCEQEFEDSMGPADPFASVMYVDFPKAGYTIAADAAVVNGTAVGSVLATTTINWDGGSGCDTPSTNSAGATLTDVSALAAALPAPLATSPGNAHAHYTATMNSFAGANPLRIDIVTYSADVGQGATNYRQYRVASDGLAGTGELGTDWSLTVCNGNIDYDIQGLAGAVNIRSCDAPGTYAFNSTWTRDDTGGDNYTDTIDLTCSASDVIVVLDKDEIIGNDSPSGDIVNQGVATERDVDVDVSGPPDTILVTSLVGPAECNPRWVAPAAQIGPPVITIDTATLGPIQTSVHTIDPAGSGTQTLTYEVTCSPAGSYELQIVANATSVQAGAEANTLNNQAENHIQVIVLADSDGDGVPSPQDNCPNDANPNQHDADSDGEGNVCDANDDNDEMLIAANAIPFVAVPVAPILDNPLAIPLPWGPTLGPDQCNPGLDFFGGGPDLDALSAAELALWQEDNDDFVVEVPNPLNPLFPGVPNFALDLDGCADTDMNVDVVKDETYDVDVSVNTPKTVTITVTNGNAAIANGTANILALSRKGKCEVRLVAAAGDLYSEFETDELELLTVDGPGGADDYIPTPDGLIDTIHSQLQISTGPMDADEVSILTRDYTIHCYQPSTQYWWDSTHDTDYNFDATFELQVDVLPDAPVVEENLADNVHKNFPLVTAFALADVKYQLTITGPSIIPIGELVDITGFNDIHNNGPVPTDFVVLGNWITPPGCSLFLGGGLIILPPGIDTSQFLGPLGFPILQPAGIPLPPSIAISDPIAPGSSRIICIQPSFHNTTTVLTILPQWPVQVGNDPESGEACQNFVDDDQDGITNDGCPQHIKDPDLGNNTSAFTNTIAVEAATELHAIVANAAPADGNVSEDEFFDVTKTFYQTITPFYNPFLPEDGVVPDFSTFPPFVPCADGADNGPDGNGQDATDADCFQGALPSGAIYPEIWETLTPPPDCSVSFHVTNEFLGDIIGGAAGLVITINDVPQVPPTPAGWEASDVVRGNPGDSVDIHFKIAVGGLSLLFNGLETVVHENWDKHCFTPSTHDFVLNTSWMMSDMDDPHLPYINGNQDDPFSEDIFAASDIKIVTDFFLDLEEVGSNLWLATYVPAKNAAETGNECQDSVDNDNDGVINDGCPVEGHQKEALHNNGPYGPTDVTVEILMTVSDPIDCSVTYDARGSEFEVNGDTSPLPGELFPSGPGGEIYIAFPATLPVSTEVWFAELWLFGPNGEDLCQYQIEKYISADDPHIIGDDYFAKWVEVCRDHDADGVHNASDSSCNGPDNCPIVYNPGQEDTDFDGLGDACDPDPNRPPDDGVVKYVIAIGPAAINLSDTTGRYMWVIAEVGNIGSDPDPETVTVTMEIDEDVPPPNGCTRTPLDDNPADGILNESMVLPGQDTFIMADEEQKFLVWRLRYECHSPATVQTFDQTVTVTIDLAGDGNPANDSQTVVKTVIIHQN